MVIVVMMNIMFLFDVCMSVYLLWVGVSVCVCVAVFVIRFFYRILMNEKWFS